MMTDQSFSELITGGIALSQWVFQILLISLGMFLRVFLRVKNRENSSVDFSILKWFKDYRNIASIISSAIMMYILIRFYSEYKDSVMEFVPKKFNASVYFAMFGLGYYFHKISWWMSKLSKTK